MERINTGEIITTYIDSEANEINPSNIIIVYSKTGSHILGGRSDET